MDSNNIAVVSNIPAQSNEGRERLSNGNGSVTNTAGLSFAAKLAVAYSTLAVNKCGCGRNKSTAYPLCPACTRYAGPNVIVVNPDGSQYRECGLPSVTETIACVR